MADLERPIVLIGPMGAGKSTVGFLLADKLGLVHYDSDAELAKRYGSINAVFSECGEDGFRFLEYRCVRQLLFPPSGRILSLGGGAPAGLYDELSGHLVVYLAACWGDVASRLTGVQLRDRPILRRDDGRSIRRSWEDLMEQRRPVYERLATLTIDVGSKPPEDVVAEILKALESRAIINLSQS